MINEKEILELEDFEEEKFKIESLEQSNWAFRKIKAQEDKIRELEDLAKKETERIEDWLESETKQYRDSISYFEGLLTSYFVRQREVDPKFKLSTPYGKVTSRKQQPKFIRDDEKFLEWLKGNQLSDFINIKETPNWGEFKKHIEVKDGLVVANTGEIVEGVEAEQRADNITVKVVE